MEQMGRHSATHVHARYEEGDGRTVHLLREKFPSPPIASFSSGPYDVSPIIDRHAMRHVAAPSLAEASVHVSVPLSHTRGVDITANIPRNLEQTAHQACVAEVVLGMCNAEADFVERGSARLVVGAALGLGTPLLGKNAYAQEGVVSEQEPVGPI